MCPGPGNGPQWLVVGLGNPGPRYAPTRHNVGFAVAVRLAGRWAGAPWEGCCHSLVSRAAVGAREVWLARPQTFMNRSGEAVAPLLEQSGLEIGRLLVVHDDLDLPLGTLRIRSRGGHGGHNGLRSVMEALGSGEFVRLKVGIGRPPDAVSVIDHVLAPFSPEEHSLLGVVLERAAAAVEDIVVEGPARAMNLLFPLSTSAKGGKHGEPS